MQSFKVFALAALMLGSGGVTAQTIYKCTDARGGVLISNSRVDKSCQAMNSGPENTLPAPKGRATTPGSPSDFPRVAGDAQKARDNDRRLILDQELSGEQRNLEQARQALAEQEAVRNGGEQNYQRVLDRLQPYKDRVTQHERNVQAIQKELNALR